MATMTTNLPTLTAEELKAITRLQKEESEILKSRSDVDTKLVDARHDLDLAREVHRAACLALASGKRADVQGCTGEIQRLEALINGYEQLQEMKTADLIRVGADLNILTAKQSALVEAAERARLEEEVRVAEDAVKIARENLTKAETAAMVARQARAGVGRGY
jgi:hypothetical protein